MTLTIGTVPSADLALSAACLAALEAGIAAAVPGGRLTDISHAVQTAALAAAERDGSAYGIVAEYGGHGIGTQMHMDPFPAQRGPAGAWSQVAGGGVLAVEPMLTAGSAQTHTLDDEWTVVTPDGSSAVHWEHTVAITDGRPLGAHRSGPVRPRFAVAGEAGSHRRTAPASRPRRRPPPMAGR